MTELSNDAGALPADAAAQQVQGGEMRVELCCCTDVLLREVKEKVCTQKSLALTYALAIQSSESKDWRTINDAIITRWSRGGLERIKKMAWALIETKTVALGSRAK